MVFQLCLLKFSRTKLTKTLYYILAVCLQGFSKCPQIYHFVSFVLQNVSKPRNTLFQRNKER